MYVRTFYNHVPMPPEHIEGKSETIPDQSLSVREIIDRYRLGYIDQLPVDEGEDEEIDRFDDDFEDLVDAQEAFNSGVDAYSSLQREVPPVSDSPSSDPPASVPPASVPPSSASPSSAPSGD